MGCSWFSFTNKHQYHGGSGLANSTMGSPLGLELLTCFSTSTMGTNLHLGIWGQVEVHPMTRKSRMTKIWEAVGQSNLLRLLAGCFSGCFSFWVGKEETQIKKEIPTCGTTTSQLRIFFQPIITLANKTWAKWLRGNTRTGGWVLSLLLLLLILLLLLLLLLHPGSPEFFVCWLETGYVSGKRFGQYSIPTPTPFV